MAANDPKTQRIITDCLETMQSYCDTYNHLFEIGTSYVKTDTLDVKIDAEVDDEDKLFFLGEHILLGCKRSRNYLIVAGSKEGNITPPNIVTIEKGKFSITTYGLSKKHDQIEIEIKLTTKTVDGPLKIAVKINDKYHFVGLAVVGAENKIGVFSIIKSLSNDDLKAELLDAVKEGSHMLFFEDENSFFNDGRFKPGINTNDREHAAAEISRLKEEISLLEEKIKQLKWEEEIRLAEEPCASKKQQIKAQERINTIEEAQIKAQERVNAIEEALKKNSPEKLHILLEKKGPSLCAFFSSLRKSKEERPKSDKLDKNSCPSGVVYRSLSNTNCSVGSPKI